MSIESDANQDLALSDDDAEGVVAGKKQAKKAVHHAATHNAAAGGTVSYTYSPPSGTPQAYTSDGDDCDDPGYAGSDDTSSTT